MVLFWQPLAEQGNDVFATKWNTPGNVAFPTTSPGSHSTLLKSWKNLRGRKRIPYGCISFCRIRPPAPRIKFYRGCRNSHFSARTAKFSFLRHINSKFSGKILNLCASLRKILVVRAEKWSFFDSIWKRILSGAGGEMTFSTASKNRVFATKWNTPVFLRPHRKMIFYEGQTVRNFSQKFRTVCPLIIRLYSDLVFS